MIAIYDPADREIALAEAYAELNEIEETYGVPKTPRPKLYVQPYPGYFVAYADVWSRF